MKPDLGSLRIDGVYPQRQKGFLMQRIKLPAGILSAEQAKKVSEISDRFARSRIHLTTRGSMELHWLTEETLPEVARQLASVGLITRGACGGAVRGVVCGFPTAGGSQRLEGLARMIHCHFSGNPHFERLPKKFKIGIEADTGSGRHLIQDLGLVPCKGDDDNAAYNVWVAGGLGREPVPGFLLAENVPEDRILSMIEAVLRLYVACTPSGKRLKHLVREIGQDEFRSRIFADRSISESIPVVKGLATSLLSQLATTDHRLEAKVFAGELSSSDLNALAGFAENWAGGILLVTADQNVAFHLGRGIDAAAAGEELVYAGFHGTNRKERVNIRVCPGNHECMAGLAPTREIAEELLNRMGPVAMKYTWAFSGCPNSCTRPQLADAGIVAARLVRSENGREPLFDLYRATGDGCFATIVQSGLTREGLLSAVAASG